jgi:hypothetical protein
MEIHLINILFKEEIDGSGDDQQTSVKLSSISTTTKNKYIY